MKPLPVNVTCGIFQIFHKGECVHVDWVKFVQNFMSTFQNLSKIFEVNYQEHEHHLWWMRALPVFRYPFLLLYIHICKCNHTPVMESPFILLIQLWIIVKQNMCAIPKLIWPTLPLFSLPFSTHPLPSSLVSPLLPLFPLCLSLSHSRDSLPPVLCPYLIGGWPLFS